MNFTEAVFNKHRTIGDHFEPCPLLLEETGCQPVGMTSSTRRPPPRHPFLDPLGRDRFNGAQGRTYGLGDGHHVGIRLLVDINLHALAPAGARQDFPLPMRSAYRGQITHPQFTRSVSPHDGVFNLLLVEVFVEGAYHVFGAPLFDQATRDVDVFLLQTTDDTLNGKTGAPEGILIQHHVNLFLKTASNPDRRHTGNGFERTTDLNLCQTTQTPQTNFSLKKNSLTREAQFHDRVKGRVKMEN